MPAVTRPSPRLHILVLLALSAVIALVNYSSYVRQVQDIESEARSALERAAASAADQLASWRAERLGDASIVVTQIQLMPAVRAFVAGSDAPDGRAQSRMWLDALRASYRYTNAVLLDSHGTIRGSSGDLLGPPVMYAGLASAGVKSDGPSFVDVGADRGATIAHFVIGVALRTPAEGAVGALLLGVDPRAALFPEILGAHGFGRSGEVLVARPEGEAAVLLSDFRRIPNTALTLRTGPEAPIVRATHGADGPVDGVDLSNIPVLAVARHVRDSSWVTLAKIDRDEALAPVGPAQRRVVARGLVLFLVAAAGLAFIWRYQVSAFYRQRFEEEQQRQALAGHYEHLTRFGNDAILLFDDKGAILDANDRATDYLLYTRAELLEMNVRQLRDPETLPELERAWQTLLQQHRLLHESRYRRKDGSSFPVEISARTMDVGDRTFVQGIVRDITERKQAEEQIRRVNRLYAVLSECSAAVVESRSEQELFNRVCQIGADVGGFSAASVLLVSPETGMLEPVASAGPAAGYIADARAERGGTLDRNSPSHVCVREQRAVVCNDIMSDPAMTKRAHLAQRYGLRSLIVLPLRRHETVVAIFGLHSAEISFFNEAETGLAEDIAREISYALDALETSRQRQQASEELRASRERLELALDATNEAVWDWTIATGTTEFSRKYESMMGYAPSEVRHQRAWAQLIHPDDLPVYNDAINSVLAFGRDAYAVEFRVRAKSGSFTWILSRARVVARDPDGKPTRIVGTHTDVTERRKLEEQFRQAQKLESVGRLAGGIAHDFNNLLTVINGYSDILMTQLNPDDIQWKHADAIRQAGERATGMTRQLLAFSRKQATQPRTLELNALVREFEGLMRRLVTENILVVTALDAGEDLVLADPSQIHQVIMNLVVNARDAMAHGGTLRIETSTVNVSSSEADEDPEATPGRFVRLDVSDTGTGMTPEVRTRIFEPFFTTKERGKGTGLGLSTVYGIVHQAGGFVRVASEMDHGTTFSVHLPLTDSVVLAEPVVAPPPEQSGSETILVVEDQDPVRGLVVETLSSRGFHVIDAADAESALRVAAHFAGPIHVLLTDVIMPGMDGKALAARLQATRPQTKILFMSGYSDEVIGARGVVGVDVAYLDKPFTPAALVSKVRDVLGPVHVPTVLVVDDDTSVRDLFSVFLSGSYNVLAARDGREAMNVVRGSAAIDVVVTDLVMPNEEGIETIKRLRAERPTIRVVAVSGAFGGQFLSTADRLGADASLLKPVSRKALLETVRNVLAAPRPRVTAS